MFKIKDLYVSLATGPGNAGNIAADLENIPFTVTHTCQVLVVATTPGCGTQVLFGVKEGNRLLAEGEASYSALKESLRLALEGVENGERQMEHAHGPQTLTEIELLQEKLSGALKELEIRKAELLKKTA